MTFCSKNNSEGYSSQKKIIEEEVGFNLNWSHGNKRAQYIRFNYNGDLTNNKNFSERSGHGLLSHGRVPVVQLL